MIRFYSLKKHNAAFTMLEMLIALTAFTFVIGGYTTFMSSQNRQVTTITQHSQANEAAMLAVQAMTFDIKSAKRGDILIGSSGSPVSTPCVKIGNGGKSITLIRSIENPDIKKSDHLYLEKVEYAFDESKRIMNKTVSKVNFTKAAKSADGKQVFTIFDYGDVKSTKTFKNISKVEFKSIKIPGKESSAHTLGVGVEVESKLDNMLIGQAQIGKSHNIVFVSDEIAYKNQPNWNVNPVFSNNIVDITLSPPLTMDFSSALDIVNWAKNFKTLIPDLVNDAKDQILDKVMIALTGKVLEEAQNLYSKFINASGINSMMNSVKGNFVNLVKNATSDPNLCAAAALLSDAFNNGNAGEALKNKILAKTLAATDIDNMLVNYGQKLKDAGTLTNAELRKFITFKDPSQKFFGEIAGTQAEYTAIIDKVRGKVYDALPTEAKISDMVNSYVVGLSDKLRLAMKDDIKITIASAVITKVVGDKIEEVLENILDSSGLQTVFDDPKLDDVGKALLNEILGMLKTQVKGLASNLIREVSDNIVKEIASKFKDKEEALQKAGENMPDAVNSMISLLSKKFLVGEKWDAAAKKFIPNPNATNYLDKVFKGFNLPIPAFDADKDAQNALNQFYAKENLDNPFK
jgi:competence protein ComGC